MSDIASILDGVDPQRFARLERSMRRARRVVSLVTGLTFVGLLAAGVWALWQGWQDGNWLAFWFPPIFALLVLVFLTAPPANMLPRALYDASLAPALRNAAATGDDRLAPPATGQPADPTASSTYTPMAPPVRLSTAASSQMTCWTWRISSTTIRS